MLPRTTLFLLPALVLIAMISTALPTSRADNPPPAKATPADIETLKKLVAAARKTVVPKELAALADKIGDAGLAHLTGLKKLKWLEIQGTKIRDESVALLNAALPGLEVLR